MEDSVAPPPASPTPRRSRRPVLRWLPAALLLLAIVICWGTVFQGGRTGLIGWYLVQLLGPLLGAAFGLPVAIYALAKRRRSLPIAATLLLALVALWPLGWLFNLGMIAYPASVETTTPSAAVRLPADVPLRVAWGGDRLAVNQHAAYPDQRWAYDLMVDPSFSGSQQLDDYGCWGVTVVAPAAGEVVAAQDGLPDEVPGQLSYNFAAPTGNHVVIQLPTETFLVVAHLQRDSVMVEVGDTVAEGQAIGRCGNSGNTSEPHIHLHHQRQHPERGGGLVEGLPLFFRDHDGVPMPEGGFQVRDGRAIPQGPVMRHIGDGLP